MSSTTPSKCLASIPTEILLHVFSFLSYDDLKSVLPLVCKSFRSIISAKSGDSSTPIDEILFRDSPRPRSNNVTTPREYELHPSFYRLEYAFYATGRSETGVMLSCEVAHPSIGGTIQLPSLRVRNENAVSPACSKFSVSMSTLSPNIVVTVDGTLPNGAVSVEDVLRGVGQIAQLNGQDLMDFNVHAVVRLDQLPLRIEEEEKIPQLHGDFVWKVDFYGRTMKIGGLNDMTLEE